MKAYFRSKNLSLDQIMDTNVESRVFLNNNFPNQIQKTILYCRRLKKLNLITSFKVNFNSGSSTIVSKDNVSLNYSGFEDIVANHKLQVDNN